MVRQLEALRERLGARGARRPARATPIEFAGRLLRDGRRFDVIFVDPPFASGLLEPILPLAAALCAPDGLVYVEAAGPLDAARVDAVALEPYRADRAGDVFYHLLQRKKQRSDEETTC